MQEFVIFVVLLGLCITEAIHGGHIWTPLILLAAFLSVIYLRRKRRLQRADFVNQLKSYRRELRGGGTVVVDSLMLRYNTTVTTYNLSIGAIITNFIIPSRHQVANGEDHGESLLYSVLSLVSGWWAFPTGPIITLSIIKRNLTGGDQITVGQLIDAPLLQAVAPQEQSTFSSSLHRKSDASATVSLSTGRGSRSDLQLDRRTRQAQNISTAQRVADLDKPPPPGIVLTRYVQARVEHWRDDTQRRVSRALSHRKRRDKESE
ncbi:MAG: hypothetical protein KDD66_11760 [Bdellovibrionales bacterium]|nr:hypothetical protein [Bdellovibrionales bacterium]